MNRKRPTQPAERAQARSMPHIPQTDTLPAIATAPWETGIPARAPRVEAVRSRWRPDVSCDLALLSRLALACMWPIPTIEASSSAPRPASGVMLAARREPTSFRSSQFCRPFFPGGQA